MTNANVAGERTVEVVPARETNFLGRLSVGQKLALSAIPLILPILISVGFNINDQVQELAKDRHALKSVNYLSPTKAVLLNSQLTRRSANLFLGGTPLEETTLKQEQAQVDRNIALLKELNQKAPIGPQTSKAISDLEKTWAGISRDINEKRITPQQSFTRLQSMMSIEINRLFAAIAMDGNLRYLQYSTTPELVNLTTNVAPRNWPDSGGIRTLTAAAVNAARANNGKVPAANLPQYQSALQVAQTAQNAIADEGQAAMAANLRDTAELRPLFDDMQARLQKVEDNFRVIATQGRIPGNPADVLGTLDPALEAHSKFYDGALAALNKAVSTEVNTLNTSLTATYLATALFGLLALWLFTSIARAITRPLGQLTDASQRLAQGDVGVQIPITTADEIGRLTSSFNLASAQLAESAQRVEMERREQEALQRNIGDFLDVTMDIAEGDLTRRGRVTEDVMGNVVDSINLMTEELGSVLKDVQSASHSVATGSETMMQSTRRMTQGTEQVVEEATRVSSRMQQMTEDIRRMARNAQESADTARLALQASQQGQAAVTDTLEGMQNIRREVLGIAKRMKTLGDRSMEIQEIVDSISQLTRQTNLLALNASVEAAGAGEAGGRFAIVADEVRKLADTSRDSATRIATLIRNIQVDIQDMIINVEESSAEVEQGYRVAGTAGERLREIGDLTEQSAALAERISAASAEQVRGVEQMGQAVQQITEISGQAGQAVREGEAVAEQLRQLSLQLDNSLNRFRLPS